MIYLNIGLLQFIRVKKMLKNYIENQVSVIIPVYNAEKFIKQAVESVLSQTYTNIEIVLVDDQSSDKSAEIIRKLMSEHPNIKYYLQEQNLGAGAARNKALELATGQYVAFLDSDDIWLASKLELQLNLMKEKHTPFSYAAIEMIDENGKLIKGKRNIKETCDYKYLLHNTIIATSSVIIDRNILGDFRMSLRRGGQDYATWLKLLRDEVIACGLNEVLVKYRITNNSLSSNKLKSIKQIWEIQVNEEKLSRCRVLLNIIRFSINAIKKYKL